ncbi:MAG: hypothetical protein WBD46_14080 [Acidobacteriaceae bacterium]
MHVHGPQFNPNYQLNAIYAAARAEARREAERTRKKLLSAASSLAAEAGEDCIVSLKSRDGGEEEASQQGQHGHNGEPQSREPADDGPFSDYA